MTNNQPPEILSDKELRQLSELFWRFHNDRLDDPTIKEMKPYTQPILDLINQQTQAARIDELQHFVAELDTQSPYEPLPGTPREYVHSTMAVRIAELRKELQSS